MPPYRSQQAATEADPFAAVYAAQVPFGKPGRYSVLAVTLRRRQAGRRAERRSRSSAPRSDKMPDVGEPAPKVQTDTVASAGGDVEAIDTRRPTERHARRLRRAGRHEARRAAVRDAAAVPVARLRPGRRRGAAAAGRATATTSTFIHQEVYADNDPNKGLREPLQEFHLPSEPWLFAVGKDGKITARLEGSFGLDAFERALKTAL